MAAYMAARAGHEAAKKAAQEEAQKKVQEKEQKTAQDTAKAASDAAQKAVRDAAQKAAQEAARMEEETRKFSTLHHQRLIGHENSQIAEISFPPNIRRKLRWLWPSEREQIDDD